MAGVIFKYPSFIQLNITNRCNLRCKHCFNDSGKEIANHLSDEEIFSLLDYFLSKGIVCITFGGGEPLMHNKIFEFIKYSKERNGRITILSNGKLLNDRIARRLRESGVYRVRISLDGSNQRINDFIRSNGSFIGAVSALKALKRVGGLKVAVMTSVNKYNFYDLENIIKLLIKIRVNDIKLIPTIAEGRAKREFKQYILDGNFVKKLLDKKEELLRKYRKAIYISIDSPLEVVKEIDNKNDKKELKNFGPCLIGNVFLGIKANGDIFSCPMLDNVVIGNIRRDDIQDVWQNSKLLNKIRNFNLLKGKCRKCSIKLFCGGGCRAISYLVYHDILKPDPFCWIKD